MFEDLARSLDDLARRAEQLDGPHSVSVEELFPDEFMLRNTDFPSVQEFFDASGFTIVSQEDFESIPADEWDSFVRNHTRFDSWGSMMRAGGQEWAIRQLNLE